MQQYGHRNHRTIVVRELLLRLTAGLCACLSALLQTVPAVAADTDLHGSIVSSTEDQLTLQILRKELEIIRINTYLERESHKSDGFRPWGQWFCQQTGAANTFAGALDKAVVYWKYRGHPKAATKGVLEVAPMLLFIGHMFLLASPVLDTPARWLKNHNARADGFDPKTTLARVKDLNVQIESLMTQRQLEQHLTDPIFAAETRVLRDLQLLADLQFAQSYSTARKHNSISATESLDSFLMAGTGGFVGALLAYFSAHGHPKLNGPAGIGFIISGAILCADPPLRKITAVLSQHHSKKAVASLLSPGGHLSQEASEELKKQLAADLQEMQALRADAGTTVLSVVQNEDRILEQDSELKAKEDRSERKSEINRFIRDELLGSTKMVWGIKLAQGGFSFTGEQSFHSIAQGATVFTVGTAYQMLDYAAGRGASIIVDTNKKRKGQAPAQIFAQRLELLDQIEHTIVGKSPVEHH